MQSASFRARGPTLRVRALERSGRFPKMRAHFLEGGGPRSAVGVSAGLVVLFFGRSPQQGPKPKEMLSSVRARFGLVKKKKRKLKNKSIIDL